MHDCIHTTIFDLFPAYCNKAKALLTKLGTPFKAVELDQVDDGPTMQNILTEKTGQRTVPNIFIKQEHIGGCDALHALHSAGKLQAKLAAL
jgi:glutaredoxin 3